MAEQIISPGVFTNESVPVTTEAPVVPVGAAIIGPTVLGPVGVPTIVTTYSDFKQKFGGTFVSGGIARNYFTNIAAYNYFQQGGQRMLVTRVMSASAGGNAFTAATSSALITGSSDSGNLPSGLGGNVFVLQTISEGDIMNTGDTESTGNTLPTGTKDNVRWEISQAETGSGTFTLSIRQGNDRQSEKVVLETYRGVNLDPRSPNFIAKRVGNQIKSLAGSAAAGYYVKVDGQYPNKSKYVIVKSVNFTTPDYLDEDGNVRISGSEFKIPGNQSGSFGAATGTIYGSQAGGTKYNENIAEANTQGLGGGDYAAAINLLKNKDEFPYNVLFTPGLIYQNDTNDASSHKDQLDQIVTNLTARGDALIPLDLVNYNQPLSTVTTQAGNLNTSYAAAYWPWVKVRDEDLAKNAWVPASTIIPSVYVFNDNNAEAWFAPAGFTRGSMPRVVAPERTLPRSSRDTLYANKVNPIATFPNTGVVVYGQKTLQTKASATDRVNVRRLLISLKGFISNVAQNLVFEPNSLATRNSFLAVVNPYLETVQQKQGLYAFKVVMDSTNNGPDVIDRNELRGAIYLQPVKTAEFIVLDFNVLPTGAEFPA